MAYKKTAGLAFSGWDFQSTMMQGGPIPSTENGTVPNVIPIIRETTTTLKCELISFESTETFQVGDRPRWEEGIRTTPFSGIQGRS